MRRDLMKIQFDLSYFQNINLEYTDELIYQDLIMYYKFLEQIKKQEQKQYEEQERDMEKDVQRTTGKPIQPKPPQGQNVVDSVGLPI